MDNIQTDVFKILTEVAGSASWRCLSSFEVNALMNAIRTKYCEPDSESSLWESIRESESYYREEGRAFAARTLDQLDRTVFLLIDDWHSMTGFEITSGKILKRVFDDMYDFRWYLTDSKGSFLLCRNDHEFIIHAVEPRTSASNRSTDS